MQTTRWAVTIPKIQCAKLLPVFPSVKWLLGEGDTHPFGLKNLEHTCMAVTAKYIHQETKTHIL